MKTYLLYVLRCLTLGAGLNFMITSYLMYKHDIEYIQAAPVGMMICINLSFFADRFIFTKVKRK